MQLQDNLNHLQSWRFHVEKCVSMRVGKSEVQQHQYTMGMNNEFPLKSSQMEKDVGVTFQTDLNFDKLIAEKINTANGMGMI